MHFKLYTTRFGSPELGRHWRTGGTLTLVDAINTGHYFRRSRHVVWRRFAYLISVFPQLKALLTPGSIPGTPPITAVQTTY
jgi:hypothetical protein